MPERFSPAQPNYFRFVSTPTIDIEPKKICTGSRITHAAGAFYCAENLDHALFPAIRRLEAHHFHDSRRDIGQAVLAILDRPFLIWVVDDERDRV